MLFFNFLKHLTETNTDITIATSKLSYVYNSLKASYLSGNESKLSNCTRMNTNFKARLIEFMLNDKYRKFENTRNIRMKGL